MSPADAFTLLNALFGLIAMVLVADGLIVIGIGCVLLAVIFDGLDGMVARRFGSKWLIGDYLDLMADTTSFAVAPAFIIFMVYIEHLSGIDYYIDPGNIAVFLGCGMLVVCGILRLARFAHVKDKTTDRFIGVPTAAVAVTLMLMILLDIRLAEKGVYDELQLFIPPISIVLSALMISDIYFWKMKGPAEWISGVLVFLSFVLNQYLEMVLLAFGITMAYLVAAPFLAEREEAERKKRVRKPGKGKAKKGKRMKKR